MLELAEIEEFLSQGKRWYVSEVRIRASDGAIVIYVPKDDIAATAQHDATSMRQLRNLEKNLRKQFSTEVVLVVTQSQKHREIEEMLHKMLNFRVDNRVVSFFMSSSREGLADCWIELDGVQGQLESDIQKHLDELLGTFDLSAGQISWLSSPSSMPTIPALLRLVKANQPVSAKELADMVPGENNVSEDMVKHAMDSLRKKGLVIWQRPGTYSLTAEGLSVVPAGMTRSSSDIGRVLALGRRKW